MKKTIIKMAAAAVVALSSISCSDNAASEKNLFADVAGKMQKRMEYVLKSMDGSLSESERTKYAEKEQAEFNEALDMAENLGGCQLPGATDDEFGLTLKGPFKVFMFNRDDGCFYLVAPAELDQDTRNFYAIGYADETPVYYIDGAEGIDDEGHLQMVMLTGDEEDDEYTEYLQVKLMIRLVDSEQLAKINRIVLTQNEELFQKLKDETAQREKEFHEKATKTMVIPTSTVDDSNLNILGISLGQSKGTIESQLKAKGFKEVTIYDAKETQGDFFGKTAAVYVYEYDGKVTVSLRDVNSYSLTQAKERVEQLKQQLLGNGTAKKWTGMGIADPSYRIMQKGGKIEIEYHDEDEENGDSGSYTVTCSFHNQDFTEE